MLQIQDQSLRPVATAHLAQTMSLLALNNADLEEKVLEELTKNPALELVDERVCPSCQRKLNGSSACPKCSLASNEESPIVFISPRNSLRTPRRSTFDDDMELQEPVAPESLPVEILRQLAAELDPQDRPLAAFILASLDEHGFLSDPPAIVARATRSTLSQVDNVVNLISHADPPGLATPGPREALIAQLEVMPQDDPVIVLAQRILSEAFSALGRMDFETMAMQLDASGLQVRKAATFIQEHLNPYPASSYWESGRGPQAADPNVYHHPDIQITQRSPDGESPLVVEIFSAVPGWLRVNPQFKDALSKALGDKAEEWTKHLEKAALFVKCLQQRNNTMRQLMEVLVSQQRTFIMQGDRFLHPMTRAEIATNIGVHESTISRAVAHKSVAMPDGRIIPLSRFFDRSLSVRDLIKEIIEKEDKPLTDDQIAGVLEEEGIRIARRTVAKYRSMEGILPARLRKVKAGKPA
jgi:RNA polymerase sigma-54 factor